MMTFNQTLTLIKADFSRRLTLEEKRINALNMCLIAFKPGMISILCYRLSRYCFHHRLGIFCKFFSLIDQFINTNEISPQTDIGPGLVLSDAGGIGIPNLCRIGINCTFMGYSSITLGALENAPTEDDFIHIGDHCVFGANTRIMRAVRLANGTQVKPCSVIITSVKKEGQTVSGIPAKHKHIDDYANIRQWNPLLSKSIVEAAL